MSFFYLRISLKWTLKAKGSYHLGAVALIKELPSPATPVTPGILWQPAASDVYSRSKPFSKEKDQKKTAISIPSE
ncbi:hypothetical protein BSK66_32255 [Paenibacillus odorifer]|nr:hypothetical protein BSK66_32255 [Paenibacillus odorifer]